MEDLTPEELRFNEIVEKLDKANVEELTFVAEKLGFEFTNTKAETVVIIKDFLGIEEKIEVLQEKVNKQGVPIGRPLTAEEYRKAIAKK